MRQPHFISPEGRLVRLLGGDELSSLRQRMRRYFERTDDRTAANGTLQLTQLSPEEREALALLTGLPSRTARSVRIDIAQLDISLRNAGIADSLRAALELIDGPIINRKAIQAGIHSEWTHLVTRDHWHGALRAWLQTPVALGRLKRLARQEPGAGRQLLDRADAVLQRLPDQGIARSQLAAEILGNAHALDNGEPVATIVLSVWRYMEAMTVRSSVSPDTDGEIDDTPQPDDSIRDIWARAGVLVNELARPALFLNLPLTNAGAVKGIPGEPSYISLRELVRTPPAWAVRERTVFVCENPNLVAIVADRIGLASAPLVSTDGVPAAAQRTLLTQLVDAGANLMYHGDFDWPGLRIGNQMMRTWQACPWRFAAQDYEVAVTNAPSLRHELSGVPAIASWDEALAPMMQQHGIAIAEEAVAMVLLEDLSRRQ